MVIRKIRAFHQKFNADWRAQGRGLVIRREVEEFQKVFKNNFVTLIISSFGLVAALSWNDAVKEVITSTVPTQSQLAAKIYSAMFVTAISILVTYLLSKLKSPQ